MLSDVGIFHHGTISYGKYKNDLPIRQTLGASFERQQRVFVKQENGYFTAMVSYYENKGKKVTTLITNSKDLFFGRLQSFHHPRRNHITVTDKRFSRPLHRLERPYIYHKYNNYMNSTDCFDHLMHNSDISMRYRRPELWIREFILKIFMLMFTNAYIKWVPLDFVLFVQLKKSQILLHLSILPLTVLY